MSSVRIRSHEHARGSKLELLLSGIMSFVLAATVSLATGLSSGCSSDTSEPAGPTALYDGPLRLDPFPSDHFLRPDAETTSGRRLDLGELGLENPFVRTFRTSARELAKLDGFSTVGGAFARFREEIDAAPILDRSPASFAERGTPIALVDVEPASPSFGRALPIIVSYHFS